MTELYLTGEWHSVREAMKLFEEDPLMFQPGTDFNYSTHGYTLLSAVLEAAESADMAKNNISIKTNPKIKFEQQFKRLFEELGLQRTFIDYERPIISHRARYMSIIK